MLRDAEKMFKSALRQQEMIDTFLLLAKVRFLHAKLLKIILKSLAFLKVCLRLDQPLGALEVYRSGLDKFPNDVSLMTGMARIYEVLGNISLSASYYKKVLGVSNFSFRDIHKTHNKY
jgi:tetratricopeptide repeat protein 8